MNQSGGFWRAALRSVATVILVTALASLARRWPLAALGNKLIWLTYYPAVMAAALFAGWYSGLLVCLAACSMAIWFWRLLGSEPFILVKADWIGLAAFVLNCTLITAMAGTVRRSRRKALAEKLRAEEASQAKSRFLAGMSHELRTPLGAILGFAKVLSADPNANDDQRRMAGIIIRSGERLLTLINNVLDMTKVELGRISVARAPLALAPFLRDLVQLLHVNAAAKGLTLTCLLAPELPAWVLTDESLLRQILLNLLGNAVKFTRKGQVLLRAAVREGHPPLLVVSVEDTGPGIAPEDRERIFDPFVQLQTGADAPGTGLGLALVRNFARALGGTVSVGGEVGRGSTFTLTLPVELASAPTAPPEPALPGLEARLAPGQDSRRILVVDDIVENAELLQRLLLGAGFEVRVARNGVEAVEAFSRWKPDLIFMDWRMPVMDGESATKAIRNLPEGRAVPIIAVSASVFDSDRVRLLEAGANDFLPKPVDFPQVVRALARHLDVRFVAREGGPGTDFGPVPGGPLDLAELPAASRAALRQALLPLEPSRIDVAIAAIRPLDAALAAALQVRARAFRYSEILDALALQAKTP